MSMAVPMLTLVLILIVFWTFLRFALIDPDVPSKQVGKGTILISIAMGLGLMIAGWICDSGNNEDAAILLGEAFLGFLVINAVAPPKGIIRVDGERWLDYRFRWIRERFVRVLKHKVFNVLVSLVLLIFVPGHWSFMSVLLIVPVLHYKTASILESLELPIQLPHPERTPWVVSGYVAIFSFGLLWILGVMTVESLQTVNEPKWGVLAGIGLGGVISGFLHK